MLEGNNIKQKSDLASAATQTKALQQQLEQADKQASGKLLCDTREMYQTPHAVAYKEAISLAIT